MPEPASDQKIEIGPTATAESEPHIKKSLLREYFESIVVTVIMAIFGITFVARSVNVPTGSMQNTILAGDYLLVNKFIFAPPNLFSLDGYTPHRPIRRGDIIVFKYPPNPAENYVKRVVGMPGETIEIRGQKVFINSQELAETRVIADDDPMDSGKLATLSEHPAQGAIYKVFYRPHTGLDLGYFGTDLSGPFDDQSAPYRVYQQPHYGIGRPFRIPDNCYFAMGDNRDNSSDSRFWGPVPRDHIVGRPIVVYASADRGGPDRSFGFRPGDFLTRGRWSRIGTLIK